MLNIVRTKEEILDFLKNLPKNLDSGIGNGMWTTKIKEGFRDLPKKFDLSTDEIKAASSGIDNTNWGEWIFDLVWYVDGENSMIDLPLVLESEWAFDYENICIDFDKLMFARTDLRVFVFQQKTESEVKAMFEKLIGRINSMRKTDDSDEYLIAGYDSASRNFLFTDRNGEI